MLSPHENKPSTVIGCSARLACQSHRHMGEGLNLTAKGTKELAGGRRLHRMVSVADGKGVVLCQPYEKLNSCFFARFT